uniref:Uncharacterized protein n=1 Tax=Steinernema glaseri TaxID=37863 RepID=A0A1I8AVX9_9BILA
MRLEPTMWMAPDTVVGRLRNLLMVIVKPSRQCERQIATDKVQEEHRLSQGDYKREHDDADGPRLQEQTSVWEKQRHYLHILLASFPTWRQEPLPLSVKSNLKYMRNALVSSFGNL